MKRQSSLTKAKKILKFALNKKASDPLILDLRKLSWWWDYFVIVSALSAPQAEAISQEVISEAKKAGFLLRHKEADSSKSWILIDFYDVICHIFLPPQRKFYNLEYTWKKAKKVNWKKL